MNQNSENKKKLSSQRVANLPKVGNSDEQKKLVPKLRFPEFRNTPDWRVTLLDKMGKLISGLTYSPDDVRESGLLVLRSSNIKNSKIDLEDCVYVDPDIKGAILLNENDILICVRNGSKALIGKNAIIPAGMPLCTHGAFMTVFRAATPQFTYQLFQTDAFNDQVAGDLGATINSINGKNLIKYKFFIPEKSEQQKIASCLSSLDEMLDAESQKLQALKAHKKGLMQELFPVNGQITPILRFPEFRGSGEWEERTLADVCRMQAGKFVAASEINESEEDDLYPCYGGNGLRGYTKSFTHQGKYSLIGRQGALCGNVMLAHGRFHATEHAVVVTPKAGVDTICLFYQLIKLDLNQYATGQAQPGLSVQNLEKVAIKISASVKEQQKIASCLSSLDELIAAQAEKIEGLKRHKKGLMQGLFPEVDFT